MENLKSMSKLYESLDLSNANIAAEYASIQAMLRSSDQQNDQEWDALSDEEKQVKRILMLKGVKKVLKPNNIDMFRFEESIIDLYESIVSCLHKLEEHIQNTSGDLLMSRLKAMLQLEQMIINKQKDPKEIENLHYDLFKHLIFDCLNSDNQDFFIQKSGILYYESKLEITQRLKPH